MVSTNHIDWQDISKKAGIYGFMDMLWQYGCQYPDRLMNKEGSVCPFKGLESLGINDGYVWPADINALIYPFALALVAYQLAMVAFKDKDKDDEKNKAKQTSFEISSTVFKGITGWTIGWYVSENEDWGMWGDIAAVGAGAAATGLLCTVGYQLYHNKFAEKEFKSALRVSALTFIAGAAWLVSALSPSLVGGNPVEKEIMRSVGAPVMTLLTTAVCVAIALYYDQKADQEQANKAAIKNK